MLKKILIKTTIIFFLCNVNAYAYLEPGTLAIIVQAIIGAIATTVAYTTFYFNKAKQYLSFNIFDTTQHENFLKYLFLILSIIAILTPYLEFINYNYSELEKIHFLTIVKTFIFILSALLFLSFIIFLKYKRNFFQILFFSGLLSYILFSYDKIKFLISFLFIKLEQFTFEGELSLIICFILIGVVGLIFIRKKSSILNLISIYIFIIFFINLLGIIIGEINNKKPSDRYSFFSEEEYFTSKELEEIKSKKNNRNIYYIIPDGAITLEEYNRIYSSDINTDRIVNEFKKQNFYYIKNVISSYTGTGLVLSQIFNLNYFLNEVNSIPAPNSLYPEILGRYKETPLGKILEKINYKFYWVGNSIINCTYYNTELCLSSDKKIQKFFVSIIPNIRNDIITNYVLYNFLQKTPFFDITNKVFSLIKGEYSVKEIAYVENDAINKFIKVSQNQKFDNQKNRFVFIHSLMPHGFALSRYDAVVYNPDCSLKKSKPKKDFGMLSENLKDDGGIFVGYKTNYLCMLKRINEFVNHINLNDPNALVIFQADHGLQKKGVVNSQEIFTLAKVPKECEDYLTRKVDNVNGIRLLLSCATNQKVKLLEKKSFIQEEDGSIVRIE